MKGDQIVGLGLSITTFFWIANSKLYAQSLPPSSLLLAAAPQNVATVSYLFVHPAQGNDGSGDGSEQAPLRTVTQALKLAQAGTVILLAPGTYSTLTGEKFPLQLKPGVTLQGAPRLQGQNTVITGGGYYLSPTSARQNITLLGVTGSGVTGVTITNPNARGYGLWIESASPTVTNNTFTANTHDGISITGNSAPTIRSNLFRRNGANGITVYGTSRAEIRENTFEQTGFAINITEKAAPRIIGNRITQNKDGIVVQELAQPILRNNSIWGNSRDGLVAIANASPNLGTGTDPGGNLFSNNGRFDLNTQASSKTILAVGNQLASDRIRGRISLSGSGGPNRATSLTMVTAPTQGMAGSNIPPIRPLAVAPRSTPKASQTQPPGMLVSLPPAPPSLNRSPQIIARPVSTSTGSDAIIIPVPPPASPLVQRSLSGKRTAIARNSGSRPPLPPPSSTIPILVPPKNIVRPPQNARVKSPGLLPVPSASIPTSSASRNVPPPPTFALAPGVRYRVIVEATDATQQAQVRSLIPTAFSTFSGGRKVLQVGAFSERTKADQLLQILLSNGLQAILEEI